MDELRKRKNKIKGQIGKKSINSKWQFYNEEHCSKKLKWQRFNDNNLLKRWKLLKAAKYNPITCQKDLLTAKRLTIQSDRDKHKIRQKIKYGAPIVQKPIAGQRILPTAKWLATQRRNNITWQYGKIRKRKNI